MRDRATVLHKHDVTASLWITYRDIYGECNKPGDRMAAATLTPSMSNADILAAAKRADELVVEGDSNFRLRVADLIGLPVTGPGSDINWSAVLGRHSTQDLDTDYHQTVADPRSGSSAKGSYSTQELGKFYSVTVADPRPASAAPGGPAPVMFDMREPPQQSRASEAKRSKTLWWAAALLFVAGLSAFYLLSQNGPSSSPTAHAPASAPPPPVSSVPPAETSPAPPVAKSSPGPVSPSPDATVEIVKTLAWPIVVVIIALVAAFLILRALRTGHSVEVKWKVSKIGEGSMVLKKTVTRMPRKTA